MKDAESVTAAAKETEAEAETEAGEGSNRAARNSIEQTANQTKTYRLHGYGEPMDPDTLLSSSTVILRHHPLYGFGPSDSRTTSDSNSISNSKSNGMQGSRRYGTAGIYILSIPYTCY